MRAHFWPQPPASRGHAGSRMLMRFDAHALPAIRVQIRSVGLPRHACTPMNAQQACVLTAVHVVGGRVDADRAAAEVFLRRAARRAAKATRACRASGGGSSLGQCAAAMSGVQGWPPKPLRQASLRPMAAHATAPRLSESQSALSPQLLLSLFVSMQAPPQHLKPEAVSHTTPQPPAQKAGIGCSGAQGDSDSPRGCLVSGDSPQFLLSVVVRRHVPPQHL